jgi:hypothetical protein
VLLEVVLQKLHDVAEWDEGEGRAGMLIARGAEDDHPDPVTGSGCGCATAAQLLHDVWGFRRRAAPEAHERRAKNGGIERSFVQAAPSLLDLTDEHITEPPLRRW